VRNRCVKEEDILLLCKFEKKQFRAIINGLKNEKILLTKVRLEPTPNCEPDPETGKQQTTKFTYFHIDYRSIVNIVKYKLHKMQEKIESDERDNSNRASFVCPSCKNAYTDLQVNQLMRPNGTLCCTFCDTEVEEDAANGSKTDSRTLLAKYNTQIAPLYELLKESENVEFTPTMIDPEPSYVEALHENGDDDGFGPTYRSSVKNQKDNMDGWKTKSSTGFNADVKVNILLDENADDEKEKKQKNKEPEWMINSTVTKDDPYSNNKQTDLFANHANDDIDDILKLETKKKTASLAPPQHQNAPALPVPADDSDDDDFISGDEDEVQLRVQGEVVTYDEIQSNLDLIKKMSDAEKADYTAYVASLYADQY